MAYSPQVFHHHHKKKKKWGKKGGEELVSLDSPTPSFFDADDLSLNHSPLISRTPTTHLPAMFQSPQRGRVANLSSIVDSLLLPFHSLIPGCQRPAVPRPPFLSRSRRRRLTGTLFGLRKGRVSFAVQEDPVTEPGLLLELAFPTSFLIEEMANGPMRIFLECEKAHVGSGGSGSKKGQKKAPPVSLWQEPVWTMYCNGRRSGFALSRPFTDNDRHLLRTIAAVSAGAGVLPPTPVSTPLASAAAATALAASPYAVGKDSSYGAVGGGDAEVMFVRAKYERVVGSKDSDAFYMMNPNGRGGGGGQELSIFLLRH